MKVYINKKELELLLDLERRLVDDSKPFIQHEEDRILIGNIIDKAIKEKK